LSIATWRSYGREELAALLTLGHRELAEEILIDPPEGVALDVHRDRGHELQQLDERGVRIGSGSGAAPLEVQRKRKTVRSTL
jgi:hypothetical protein